MKAQINLKQIGLQTEKDKEDSNDEDSDDEDDEDPGQPTKQDKGKGKEKPPIYHHEIFDTLVDIANVIGSYGMHPNTMSGSLWLIVTWQTTNRHMAQTQWM